MDTLIKLVAEYFIILPFVVCLIVIVQLKSKQTKWHFVIKLLAAGILALILARIASMIWSDPRPFVVGHFTPLFSHSTSNGFPSDHTLLASLIGWVVLSYSRKYGIITLVIALLIGTARVLAGVHHPIDVIGSFVISAIATFIVLKAISYIASHRTEKE